jgi:hypothetical protein
MSRAKRVRKARAAKRSVLRRVRLGEVALISHEQAVAIWQMTEAVALLLRLAIKTVASSPPSS